jgi:hypothetical protein
VVKKRLRNDIEVLNTFVAELAAQSSRYDFPHRGIPLVWDRKLSTEQALDIVAGVPCAVFAQQLVPFLNLPDDEHMLCVFASRNEQDLTRCPVVAIAPKTIRPVIMTSSLYDLLGIFPWNTELLLSISDYVTKHDPRVKNTTLKSPTEKFSAKLQANRKFLHPAFMLQGRIVPIDEDPISTISAARARHRKLVD